MLSQVKKQEIIRRLNEKIQDLSCPMCHQHSFIIADGYINNTMQDDIKMVHLGGTSIPTIAIVCSNCGFVSQHALGVLGLLPNNEKEEKQ